MGSCAVGLVAVLLLASVCALGIIVGYFVGSSTSSEVLNGMYWLVFLQELLLTILVFVALHWTLPLNLAIALSGLFFAFLLWVSISRAPLEGFTRFIRSWRTTYGLYFLLGIDLVAGYRLGLARLVPAIIFLYGLPTGSIVAARKGAFHQVALPAVLLIASSVLLFVFL